MRVVVKVNPAYNHLKDFLKSIPVIFDEKGETLKNDRNEIKVIEHDNLKLCIKSFKRRLIDICIRGFGLVKLSVLLMLHAD